MGVGQLRIRNSESHHPSVRLSWLTFEWSSSSSGSGVSPLVLSARLGLLTSGRRSSARTAPVSCYRLPPEAGLGDIESSFARAITALYACFRFFPLVAVICAEG